MDGRTKGLMKPQNDVSLEELLKPTTDLIYYSQIVGGNSPKIIDFTKATHNHTSMSEGGQLTASAFANNAITAPLLSTNTILLSATTATANQSTNSATAVQITGLSASVTVPAGGRSVKITLFLPAAYNGTANCGVETSIWDGTVGSGTQIGSGANENCPPSNAMNLTAMAFVTPSAGAKTYNAGFRRLGGGDAQTNVSATSPGYLLVELI